jgi:hypothetical protein
VELNNSNKMNKQIRNFRIDYTLDWEYGVEISKLEEDIKAIKELGANYILVESRCEYDCAATVIEPIAKRMETEEEYIERMREIENYKEREKQRELNQLKALKEKYEPNNL